jgi:uncharacterized FlaG/YvyC family protein
VRRFEFRHVPPQTFPSATDKYQQRVHIFSEGFEMEIKLPDRRMAGLLDRNQLMFLIDRATHKLVIRMGDPETHEVVLELPPDYVLRLAQDVQNC